MTTFIADEAHKLSTEPSEVQKRRQRIAYVMRHLSLGQGMAMGMVSWMKTGNLSDLARLHAAVYPYETVHVGNREIGAVERRGKQCWAADLHSKDGGRFRSGSGGSCGWFRSRRKAMRAVVRAYFAAMPAVVTGRLKTTR